MNNNTNTNINEISDNETGEILRTAKRMGLRKLPIREAKKVCQYATEIHVFDGRVLMADRIGRTFDYRWRAFDSVEDASGWGRQNRVVAEYTASFTGALVIRQWLNDIGAVSGN